MKYFRLIALIAGTLLLLTFPGIIYALILGSGTELFEDGQRAEIKFKYGLLENSFFGWFLLLSVFGGLFGFRDFAYWLGKRLHLVQINRVRLEIGGLIFGLLLGVTSAFLFLGYLPKEIRFSENGKIELVNGYKRAAIHKSDIEYWCVQYFGSGKSRTLQAKIGFKSKVSFKPSCSMLAASEVSEIKAHISSRFFEQTTTAGINAQQLLKRFLGRDATEGCPSKPYGS